MGRTQNQSPLTKKLDIFVQRVYPFVQIRVAYVFERRMLPVCEVPVKRKEVIPMKTTFRGRIRDFLTSEAGKVGVKSPLTLGVATGSVLLVQAIVGTPPATAECMTDADCPDIRDTCHNAFLFCPENGDPGWWVEGTCY